MSKLPVLERILISNLLPDSYFDVTDAWCRLAGTGYGETSIYRAHRFVAEKALQNLIAQEKIVYANGAVKSSLYYYPAEHYVKTTAQSIPDYILTQMKPGVLVGLDDAVSWITGEAVEDEKLIKNLKIVSFAALRFLEGRRKTERAGGSKFRSIKGLLESGVVFKLRETVPNF